MFTDRFTRILFAVLFLSFALLSCSDDPLSDDTNGSDAPEFPALTPYEVDNEYFEEGQQMDPGNNFMTASTIVQTANTMLTGQAQIIGFYYEIIQEGEVERDGNQWIWTQSASQGPESFEMVAIMTEESDGISYEIRVTGEVFEEGEPVEDFLFMDGSVNSDETQGDWNIYQPELGSVPVASYTFSETDVIELTALFRDDAGDVDIEFTYLQDGDDHQVDMVLESENVANTVIWDTDLWTGYYTHNDEPYCWDEDLQDAECNLI